MTIEEAIKHCEEVAKMKEKQAYEISMMDDNGVYHSEVNKCDKCAKEHRQLAEWLKELKQLREQTRWIPVSERLPKVADCYTVTRKIGSDLIVDACFFDGMNTWHNDNRINHERNYLANIVAWMLPPQPYKAESEGKE